MRTLEYYACDLYNKFNIFNSNLKHFMFLSCEF